MPPAAGQGAIAIQCIENPKFSEINKVISSINNEKAFFETKAERSLIHNLKGNCKSPISSSANLINNKTLILEGVGYKFQVNGKILVLSAGFSHTIDFVIPDDLQVKLESPTKITISGINKEKVGFFASKIREKRPPEPYKGKGILFEGERVLRKAGKTGR